MPELRKIISDQRFLLFYHIAGMTMDLLTRCLNIAQFSVARTNSKANNIHIAEIMQTWPLSLIDSFQQRFTQAILSLKNHSTIEI